MNDLVAKRYAKGLYSSCDGDIARAKKYLDILQALTELLKNENIYKVLKNPAISLQLKFEALQAAVKQVGSDNSFLNFIKTMNEAGRLTLIPQIATELNTLVLAAEGVLRATLVTAVNITDQHKKEIKTSLEERFKRKIELDVQVDKSILGGFVVRIGNAIIDLSLKTKLDKIAQIAVNA